MKYYEDMLEIVYNAQLRICLLVIEKLSKNKISNYVKMGLKTNKN